MKSEAEDEEEVVATADELLGHATILLLLHRNVGLSLKGSGGSERRKQQQASSPALKPITRNCRLYCLLLLHCL